MPFFADIGMTISRRLAKIRLSSVTGHTESLTA